MVPLAATEASANSQGRPNGVGPVRTMTYNLYVGADIFRIVEAGLIDPNLVPFVVAEVVGTVMATDFPAFRDLGPVHARVVGARQRDKTPSGLWPSDHAGVAAKLIIPVR
jgi:hypothetical protein